MKEKLIIAIGFVLFVFGGLAIDSAFSLIPIAAGLTILMIEGRKYGDTI